jgi:hypothetical protein
MAKNGSVRIDSYRAVRRLKKEFGDVHKITIFYTDAHLLWSYRLERHYNGGCDNKLMPFASGVRYAAFNYFYHDIFYITSWKGTYPPRSSNTVLAFKG